ncbi:SdrD B-like domain-containing protein [Streptomyces griseiscabiei]|uniref:SdrD B-like domain-containing protein n=1 Tax=Streptomyces griseiscabiei TaxID=2993540 RepID=A0ABU4LKP8_9ACTN|nr:SdrD B-like domain-containing protein [Streptomyces griseiscabiei]MDX2915825.1 SdrD B-like domain-containing protein [Streptomyces griseiscabiei]
MKRRTPGGVGLALAVSAALVVGLAGEAVPAAPGARSTVDGRAPGDGNVTVRVVNEVDADGTYDHGLEKGREGVRVTLTDDHGAVVTRTTNAYGIAWFQPSATPLRGGKYRVQVYNPDPRTLQPALAGLGDGPAVMRSGVGFVEVAGGRSTTYTTGFWEPGVYCQENPDLVTCNLTKGDAPDTHKGLVRFAGNFSGAHPGGTVEQLTNNTQQGAVFGIGNDRTGNTYMGTLVKRHAAYGPAGATNTVYRRNSASGVTTFVTLPGLLTEHDESDDWLRDNPVYSRVGREGIGDVDVSGDGRTLYAVSLNDSRLYAVPILGNGDGVYPGRYRSHVIPKPAECAGHWHPYGIGVRGGRVLVGGVCGAENTVTKKVPWGDPSQVTSHVYEFAKGSFRPLFHTAMNYPRGCAYRTDGTPAGSHTGSHDGSHTGAGTGSGSHTGSDAGSHTGTAPHASTAPQTVPAPRTGPTPGAHGCAKPSAVGRPLSAMWEAWNQRVPEAGPLSFVSAPQPILANIEIADNGDLILGFRDRFADMQGTATYPFNARKHTLVRAVAAGDVLRVCTSRTTYTLENNARCDALYGALPNNDEGPGHGEFYADSTRLTGAHEDQVTQGGTALLPYRNKLWSTVYDPFDDHPWEQGVRRWNAHKGTTEANLTIQRTWSDKAASRALLFGKGNGLADLELVCDRAPVQIGNRVWYDVNGNGIQEPSEPPVKGVKVRLDTTSSLSDRGLTTATDANGEYYLGSAQGLKPNTTYRVSFDYGGVDTNALPGRPSRASLKWTVKDAGGNRAIDSDVDGYGRTTVRVGDPGHVNHTVDAGLTKSVRLTLVKLDKKSDKPLPGAVFELWQDTNGVRGLQRFGLKKDRFVNDCASSHTGRCSFGSLLPGTYHLVETDVPEGYLKPKQPVTGPYVLTPKNASAGSGLTVKLFNVRGEPCKGKKC